MQQDFDHDKIPATVTTENSTNNACHICYKNHKFCTDLSLHTFWSYQKIMHSCLCTTPFQKSTWERNINLTSKQWWPALMSSWATCTGTLRNVGGSAWRAWTTNLQPNNHYLLVYHDTLLYILATNKNLEISDSTHASNLCPNFEWLHRMILNTRCLQL